MRTFLGIPLPASLHKTFPSLAQALHHASLKPVAPELFHITFFFFGNQPPEAVKKIKETITKQQPLLKPMRISNPYLCFLPKHKPRVICLGFKEEGVSENYTLLQKALKQKEQRAFVPHLTLARVKRPIEKSFFVQLQQHHIKPISLSLPSLVFYESILTPLGPVYKVIERWKISAKE